MSPLPEEPRPFATLPGNLAPLGYRNFSLYWFGFAITNLGKWIEQTGAVWLVYALTGSPVLLGFLGIARAVPAIVLGPIAGVFADRVDQRRLLFATQGLAAIASLALGILVLTGQVQFWHVYIQVAIQSGITAFDAAVRQALFPRLVPRQALPEAVTLTFNAGKASGFVGPVIGGVAIAAWGVAAPFLLNAATFLMLMGAVVAMRGVVPRTAVAGSTIRGELLAGLRYMIAAPVLRGLLRLEILFGVFQLNAVIITIIAREVLGVGPEGLGGLLAAPALGALIGVACILILGQRRRPGRFVVLCQIGYAATMVAFAWSRDYALSFAALAIIGLLDAFASVTRASVLQLTAPGHMRGRVMANVGTVTRGIGPLSETQSGFFAGVVGGPLAAVAAAVALAAGAVSTARGNPTLWRFADGDDAALANADVAALPAVIAGEPP